MIIVKGNSAYIILESSSKWTVKKESEKFSIAFDISKEICKTEDDLREYVLSNELF